MSRFYLDDNATTKLDPRVFAVMAPRLEAHLGNPSSLHAEGRRARGEIDSARDAIAAWLRAKPSEIIFTSGGTESCNLAVQGLARAHAEKGRHLITAKTEHHAVLHAFQALGKSGDFDVTFLEVDANGLVDPSDLADTIRKDTTLVSIMSANNETGMCQPMRELGEICAKHGVLFHTDAIQSAGKELLDLKSWQVSALSLTAHKMHGPLGAGLLWLKAGVPLARLMEGGSHENERRPGTENAAALAGFAEAIGLHGDTDAAEAQRQFRWIEALWRELEKFGGVRRNGDPTRRLPNTLNVSFHGLHGEDLLIGLDLAGLAVSSGSACLVGSVQPSHVLAAMGVPADWASATVRFSIGAHIKDEDVVEIARRVRDVVERQRALRGLDAGDFGAQDFPGGTGMSTKNSAKKLRVGIVGAGGIVKQRHLPGLQALPNVQVVAVCNSRIESAQAVAKEFDIPEAVGDWAELLDRRDIDIIWIGTPPVLHAPITISALEAGKHVFCQARMAMNLREGREMLVAAQTRPNLVTMLCPPPHGMKGGKFFQKLLRDGYAGEIWQFRLLADRDTFSDPHAPPHWRQRTELNGINCLTVGIYAEVLQRWLGAPRRLHAQMKVSVPKRDGYTVHVPDVVQVIGHWPNGIAGSLEWSGVAQFPPDETLTIYGRDGTLVYNFTTDEILGARRGDKKLVPLEIPEDLITKWTVEKDFIDAVVNGGDPEPSFETGVQYLEFTEAVNLSARGGHAVELPLP